MLDVEKMPDRELGRMLNHISGMISYGPIGNTERAKATIRELTKEAAKRLGYDNSELPVKTPRKRIYKPRVAPKPKTKKPKTKRQMSQQRAENIRKRALTAEHPVNHQS